MIQSPFARTGFFYFLDRTLIVIQFGWLAWLTYEQFNKKG